MKKRSYEKELIDLGDDFYTKEEYEDCLKQLGRVGKWLLGNRAALYAFNQLDKSPKSILDVGCGGGNFTRLLALKYSTATVTGIDFSEKAICYANKQLSKIPIENLKFEVPNTLELEKPSKSVDLITATLVCHHMNDDELIDFLKRAKEVATQKIIINDLHRHPLAYLSYLLIAPLAFQNRLITHDGLLSVKRSFIKKEWVSYLKKAGIENYTIKWKFPFRWIITITP